MISVAFAAKLMIYRETSKKMGKKMKKNKDAPYSPKALVTKRPLAVSLAMRMRGRSHWPLAISFSAITFSKPAALLWSDKPLFVAIKDTQSLTSQAKILNL